jgi:putative membrane protein
MSNAWRSLFPPIRIGLKLWSSTIVVGLYGLLAYYILKKDLLPLVDSGAESTVFSGLVLGFLISFRNNAAYDRWWEARKLWGQLINHTRNLCIKVKDLREIPDEDRHEVGMILAKFGNELKVHLRRGEPKPATHSLFSMHHDTPVRPATHRPIKLAEDLYKIIGRWRREGLVDGMTLLWLDEHAKALMDICGACERIRNTPLAPSYRALLRHGIFIYLALGPIYTVEDSGLKFLPLFMLGSYFLLGLEFVAEDVEEPFGKGGDNLALEAYCVTIERSVEQILGVSVDSGVSQEKLLPHNPVLAH